MPHEERNFARVLRDLIFDVAVIATQRALVAAEDLAAGLECALTREHDGLLLSRLRRGRPDVSAASKDNRRQQAETHCRPPNIVCSHNTGIRQADGGVSASFRHAK
jgi:hypothetical protein